MQKNLFGDNIEPESSKCLKTVLELDANSLKERTRRCEFLFSILPDSVSIGSDESYYMWIEIKLAYITGCFISTIILAHSFIERKFQSDYHMSLYSKKAKLTLNEILKDMKKDKSLDPYWIERIDKIRIKRNPLVHFKDVLNKASITQHSGHDHNKAVELLEQDAKEALEIMFVVSRMHLLKANLPS